MKVIKDKKVKPSKKSIPNENLLEDSEQRKEFRGIKSIVMVEQLEKLLRERLITKKEFEKRRRQIGV